MSAEPESEAAQRQRRQAVRELGQALRELNEAAVSTEVDTDTLRRAAEQARQMAVPLLAATRSRSQMPSTDGNGNRRRMFNPAVGTGHPFAPPMRVDVVDGVAVGTCTLGLMHEGPPSYGHGGISALLLDQILGHAHAINGRPGMTVMLSLRYRRPVPLQTPLRIAGWLEEGRTEALATISTAEEPETVLVKAEGTFITPNPDQTRRLFGDLPTFTARQ